MRIAVFLPNWIGDVVMATPAIRALRQHFPAAQLLGICKPYVLGVLEGSPWFEKSIFLDSQGSWENHLFTAARKLGAEDVDLAILFPNSFRSALVAWLAGCSRRVGFNRYLRGPLLTDSLSPLLDSSGQYKPTPIIDDYNRLAQVVGCPPPGHRMELFTTPKDEQAADQVWDGFGLAKYAEVICLNPGAAFGSAKHWPAAAFALVARELVRRRGNGILVLCGPGERDLARQITEQAQVPGVFSLADQPLSLGLTKALVRRAGLLVTTDSGPRHFAAAFQRPVVTLFGPTHIPWTETYFPLAINLQKQVPCGPCQLRVCPRDHRCMKELTPAEVLASVNQLLDRPRSVPCARKAS